MFRMSYETMMTVASFEIAKCISKDAFGIIFGINMWAALCLQTLLTITVASSAGLALPVPTQFVVYGALYGIAGIAFFGFYIFRLIIHRRRTRPSDLPRRPHTSNDNINDETKM